MDESGTVPSRLLHKVARGVGVPVPPHVPRFIDAGPPQDDGGEVQGGIAMDGEMDRTLAESASGVSIRRISDDHAYRPWEAEGNGASLSEATSFHTGNLAPPVFTAGRNPLPADMVEPAKQTATGVAAGKVIDWISGEHAYRPWEDGRIGVMREDEVGKSATVSNETGNAASPDVPGGGDANLSGHWTPFKNGGPATLHVVNAVEAGDFSDKQAPGDEDPGFNASYFEVIDGARFRRKSGQKGMTSSVAVSLLDEQLSPIAEAASSKEVKTVTRELHGHFAGGEVETGTASAQARGSGDVPAVRDARVREESNYISLISDDRSAGQGKVVSENPDSYGDGSTPQGKPDSPASETLRSMLSEVFLGPAIMNEPPPTAAIAVPDSVSGPQKGTVRIGSINIHVKGREEQREEHWPSPPTYADHAITMDWEWACRYGR